MISTVQLRLLREATIEKVQLSCDEYHAHSNRCLVGNERDLAIIGLIDEILRLRKIVSSAYLELDK